MRQPSRDAFRALARDHTVVPVWREVLADLVTPVAAFGRLVGEGPGFLLESVEHGERWSRFSFLGRNPSATLVARGGRLEVEGSLPATVPRDRGVLAAVEAILAAYRSPRLPELPPMHGGLVGYLGYDVVREVERLPDVPPDDLGHPDAVLFNPEDRYEVEVQGEDYLILRERDIHAVAAPRLDDDGATGLYL